LHAELTRTARGSIGARTPEQFLPNEEDEQRPQIDARINGDHIAPFTLMAGLVTYKIWVSRNCRTVPQLQHRASFHNFIEERFQSSGSILEFLPCFSFRSLRQLLAKLLLVISQHLGQFIEFI
jgi:hypothetical protein